MISPRIRRLKLDHERLENRFRDWPAIRITGYAGVPPEQYQITYRLKGLFAAPDGRILDRDEHIAEINLSLGYPRRPPQCKMLTPIFHPNFDESSICIGDFWAASEGLDDLVVRIGRMIAYKEYNTKSPLNGLAARWAVQNADLLPVDHREIAPPMTQPIEEAQEKLVVTLPSEDDRESAPNLTASIDFGSGAYVLDYDVTTIGRAEDNMICVPGDEVSHHHAEIYRTSEGFILRDLGSTNGTWIGEFKIDGDAFLADQDVIVFGNVTARFSVSV
jgi:ubiquitin-protein ligase